MLRVGLGAQEGLAGEEAALAMTMSLTLVESTDQALSHGGIAILSVAMGSSCLRCLGLRDQDAVALLGVDMGGSLRERTDQSIVLCVAALVMAVRNIVRQSADYTVLPIPALGAVDMEPKGLPITYQYGRLLRNLHVTLRCMEMLLIPTVSVCGGRDCRKDQCIGGTEYHDTCQNHEYPLQTILDPPFSLQLLGADNGFVIHTFTPCLIVPQ
jgi:hypothetical protein